jgi:hypothetical protein
MNEAKLPLPHLRAYHPQPPLTCDPETGMLVLPPLPDEHIHEQIMEDLRTMTKEEFFQSLVDAGIYYPDGSLTEFYRDDDDDDQPTG